MTTIEKSTLERTLSAAFHGGEKVRRELRLSDDEAEAIRPFARLTPLPGAGTGKRWFDVEFKGALVK